MKEPTRGMQLALLTLPAVLAIAMGGKPAAPASESAAGTAAADTALLARGEYVAKAADCAGCHTAPRGGAPYAGGLGMGSPFGTIVSSNITPDVQYGIGGYTLDEFARAVRAGQARGGKQLYPAMPYTAFSKMSDDDMRALYAFFMHRVAPVAKSTPPSDVAFPFNVRPMLYFWKKAFMPAPGFKPDPAHDADWNRGAYLVQSLGHCGACHTPRGFAYEEQGYDQSSPKYLTGGINDHWFAPNLTNDSGSGIGRLTEEDIAAFLKTGHAAGTAAFGSMVQQIEDSTQYLSDADLHAIGHYLKSLPTQDPANTYAPAQAPAQTPTNGNRVPAGLSVGYRVYQSFCARCHGDGGRGVPKVFPALAGNPAVATEDTSSLIRLLVEGGNSPATQSGPPRQQMPGFAGLLADVQLAQVLTYIRGAWGNVAQPVTANDVASMRSTLHK